MHAASAADPTYVAGRSQSETARRLERQAELFEQPTRRLFDDAGITTGMKVLDLGSGAGDVALIAAKLVGPTGRVVGVDPDPAVVATAGARAQALNLAQVSFIAGDIREIELERDFDAVVGRFVLMYLADPVAGLRAALRMVRDDGLAAFYESNQGTEVASFPVSPLHQLLGRCVNESCARGGVELQMGTKLYQVFLAAGLDTPQLRSEALIGGGRDWLERFTAAFTLDGALSILDQELFAESPRPPLQRVVEDVELDQPRNWLATSAFQADCPEAMLCGPAPISRDLVPVSGTVQPLATKISPLLSQCRGDESGTKCGGREGGWGWTMRATESQLLRWEPLRRATSDTSPASRTMRGPPSG